MLSLQARRFIIVVHVPSVAVEQVPIGDLQPDAGNPRKISDNEMEALTKSLHKFGFVQPVLVRRQDNVVVAGHQRLVAARRLGYKTVPVIYVDLSLEQARLLNVALNKISGDWDRELLARLLADLDATPNIDISLTGFGDDEIVKLLKGLDARERRERVEDFDVDEALAKAQRATRVQPGERWRCGDHVLLCGDATNPDDVTRLMGDERAALMASDPPYLVDYVGAKAKAKKRAGAEPHWDDFQDNEQALAFYAGYLQAALPHLLPDAAVYQWHAHRRQAVVEQAWHQCGLLVHEQLIWVKPRGVPSRSHFMWQHEPCIYGWREGHMPKRKPPRTETTVWQIDHQTEQLGAHPTQKPLEIFLRPITYHTQPNDVCYEPFAGSGTQLVAAEKLGRRCFALERDPHFCAVSLARLEAFTGETARRAACE
jgi:DNA modification methylase